MEGLPLRNNLQQLLGATRVASMASSAPARLKAVVFDFDSTLSTPLWIERAGAWAVADNLELFQIMSEAEQRANLGGDARIAQLAALLEALQSAGVQLYIVSIGMRAAFAPHLQAVGLLRFFDEGCVFGQDTADLRRVGFVKARLIGQIMAARGWAFDDVLFVDDSSEHIERAAQTCHTLLVSPASKSSVGGMGDVELGAVRALAGLPPAG